MLTIQPAQLPHDRDMLADLMLGFIETIFALAPDDVQSTKKKYDPAKVHDLVDGFASVHSRPGGEILIAYLNDQPVGCGMMREREPDVAELQRIFVRPEVRGAGVGRAITEALIAQAKTDGKRLVRLDTGKPMVAAAHLYESMGFVERDAYHNETPYLNHLLRFFEYRIS